MITLVIASLGLLFIFYVLRKFSEQVSIFVQDTLKEKQLDGTWKWSKTALTMASAWYSVLFAFFFELLKKGFDIESFLIMACVGTGIPIASAYAKKINPLVQAPVSTQTSETKVTADTIKQTETQS